MRNASSRRTWCGERVGPTPAECDKIRFFCSSLKQENMVKSTRKAEEFHGLHKLFLWYNFIRKLSKASSYSIHHCKVSSGPCSTGNIKYSPFSSCTISSTTARDFDTASFAASDSCRGGKKAWNSGGEELRVKESEHDREEDEGKMFYLDPIISIANFYQVFYLQGMSIQFNPL